MGCHGPSNDIATRRSLTDEEAARLERRRRVSWVARRWRGAGGWNGVERSEAMAASTATTLARSMEIRDKEHARETAQEIMHDRIERACVLGEEEADEGVPHPEHHRAGIAHLALRWTPPPKTSSQSTATRRQRSSKEAT